MPLQHERGIRERQAMVLHRQRRGRHQQVHHPVAERAGPGGHDERGLARNHRQRPPTIRAGALRHLRKLDARQHRHRQQRHHGQRQIRAQERRDEQFLGEQSQVGPHHRPQQAARHHQRHRLLARRARPAPPTRTGKAARWPSNSPRSRSRRTATRNCLYRPRKRTAAPNRPPPAAPA